MGFASDSRLVLQLFSESNSRLLSKELRMQRSTEFPIPSPPSLRHLNQRQDGIVNDFACGWLHVFV